MSAYIVQLAKDGAGRQLKRPLDDGLLGQRYNMANPDSFINIPTDEDLVNSLIQLLNARSPKGYHEYALLRMALPEFRIPEPPSAPAASHVVSGGFGQNPSTIVHTPQPPPANAMAAFGVGATSGADEDDNINMNSTPAAGMAAAAASAQQGSGVSTPNPVVPGDSVGAQAESFVNRLLKSKRPGG
jgi:hypothetical protein